MISIPISSQVGSSQKVSPSPSTNKNRTEQTDHKVKKIGYSRVSTLNEEQTTSIDSQNARLKAYGCEEVYSDRLTGGCFDRSGLLQLKERALREVKSQPVRIVITDGGRFGRHQIEWLMLVEEMQKAGVECWSLDEGEIDLNSPSNRLIWSIKASFWEFQRLEGKSKILNAAERRRNSNRRMGGPAPFGYRWKKDNSQLEPDPAKWEIARQLVLKYIDGVGLIALEKWLKSEYNVKFRPTSILGWLRNPAIKGHSRYRQVRGEKHPKIHYGTHQPLLTPSEIKGLEYRIANNQFAGTKRTVRACSRLLRCESCKNRLRLKKCPRFGHEYWYFWCHGSGDKKCPHSGVIRYERVEPLILDAICNKAASIADALLQPEQEQDSPQVSAKQADLGTYQQLHQQNPRPELQTLIENVQREIAYLQSQHEQLKIDTEQRNELVVHLAKPEFWEGLSEADRNQIYTELGVVIWCRGNEIVSVVFGS